MIYNADFWIKRRKELWNEKKDIEFDSQACQSENSHSQRQTAGLHQLYNCIPAGVLNAQEKF